MFQPRAGRSRDEDAPSGRNWLAEPRVGVLAVLGLVVAAGGGRRLFQAHAARKAVERLRRPDVAPEEVLAASRFGRAGLHELFRLQGEASSAPLRDAAARALANLWNQDELIAEEEQALVRRGFVATWHARRRYPRDLTCEIPIRVDYGLPFLSSGAQAFDPAHLEWSHRIKGARRASVERESPPARGEGRAAFSIVPTDFDSDGPHRLALQASVSTVGLTDSWRIELPHVPFAFEFDRTLTVDSLLASPDADREQVVQRAVRLEPASENEANPPRFLALDGAFAIRNPPRLIVSPPLPHDLAHRVWIEIEGVDARIAGGALIVHGRSLRDETTAEDRPIVHELDSTNALWPAGAVDRPGRRAVRVALTADPNLGWTDPWVRSVWPGEIRTGFVEVDVVRR